MLTITSTLRRPFAAATVVGVLALAAPAGAMPGPSNEIPASDTRNATAQTAPAAALPASDRAPAVDDDGFAWLDAAIGAGVAALLAIGLVSVSRRRHASAPALNR